MMKKIVGLFIFILCCILCVAQNIDNEKLTKDWDRLVDYVNCKYVNAYILSTQEKDPAYNEYLNKIQPKIYSCSVDKPIPYDSLSKLLEKDWSNTQKNICAIINNRKQINPKNINSLLAIDTFEPSIQSSLEECKANIGKELVVKYSINENTQSQQAIEQQDENDSDNGSGILVWILLAVVILEGLCIALLWRRSMAIPDDEYIKDVCYKSERMDRKMQLKLQQYVDSVEDLKKRVSMLEFKSSEQYQNSETPEKKDVNNTKKISIEIKPEIILYAMSDGDGYLRECDENKAQYKLKLKDDSSKEASFEFCGEQLKAVARIDATFKDVCETLNYKDTATRVEMQKNGKAILQEGRWKVIEKGIVKFS